MSPFQPRTADSQLIIAGRVRECLGLSHLTPSQVLSYLLSAKGQFGKTAGCYSLLARDHPRPLAIPQCLPHTETTYTMDFRSLAKKAELQKRRMDPPPPSFWDATLGLRARKALPVKGEQGREM